MTQAIVESLDEVWLPMITTLRQSDLLPGDHHLQQGLLVFGVLYYSRFSYLWRGGHGPVQVTTRHTKENGQGQRQRQKKSKNNER